MKARPENYQGLTQAHADRVLARCVAEPGGCWLWTGAKTSKGYGNISIRIDGRRRWLPPHRVVFIVERGPLDPALELDHLCRDRLCCNPEHLEPVTTGENTRRGESFAAVNAAATHCKRGHPFTPANTWRSPTTGRRKCRTCQRERRRKRYTEIEAPAAARKE